MDTRVLVCKAKDTAGIQHNVEFQIKPWDCSNSHVVVPLTDLTPTANSIDSVVKFSTSTSGLVNAINLTELSIPLDQTDNYIDDNIHCTLDWLLSNLLFSESELLSHQDLEEATDLPWLHELSGPNEEEVLDNSAKPEVIGSN
ncbi:hypothetical protein L873DRAFT_1795619 [Choiromyces venosus 120613-1]|uniref:Uncharacterized protein n=1 Tax=Choiromyces venosus 120613-1 TaxID=1336337 RepID=A0A3N4IW54_9PEZI|nr:hypothetical protein L873DRAFT_1795619 [Choiromyces venosus 120613-1]